MKNYKIIIPNKMRQSLFYDTLEEAENTAKIIINSKTMNYRFISLFHKDKLLTIFIKKHYDLYSFKSFKYLDEIGRISDYFILHQDGIDNYYIKIKK